MFSAIAGDSKYRDVSYYAMQLRPYRKLFGDERVFTITFEQLTAQPSNTMERIFRWLNVDSRIIPSNIDSPANVTPRHVTQVQGSGWLHGFRHSKVWDAVGPQIPARIRRWGRGLAERSVDRLQQSTDSTIVYLRGIQQEQTAELTDMLDTSFEEWTTLYGNGSPLTSGMLAQP
jgi:hypothetical protein